MPGKAKKGKLLIGNVFTANDVVAENNGDFLLHGKCNFSFLVQVSGRKNTCAVVVDEKLYGLEGISQGGSLSFNDGMLRMAKCHQEKWGRFTFSLWLPGCLPVS
jgi:hypothetical protein